MGEDERPSLKDMTTFIRDLRLAVRSILKSRGFAVTAILTLGLGMALCTTAMVVMKVYLLQGLPYPAAERLHAVRYAARGQAEPRQMERLDWASLNDVIEHPVAWDLDVFYLLGGETAESIPGAWVTPGFVRGLGIQPALGRTFDDESFTQGGPNVALISHRLWNGRFGGDPAIIGRTFSAYVSDRPQEAESFTIIGVMPASFWHVNPYTDIFAPLRAPTYPYLVRLRAGVTPRDAAARITALVTSGARDVPQNWTVQLVPTHDGYVQGVRPLLKAVTGAAALVLLVACANVAGLLLIRAARRQKEIAIRLALGATRLAIARMLFAEAVVLAVPSTVLALFLTQLTVGWLAPSIQQQLGRPAPGGAVAFGMDAAVIGITAAIAIITVLICALAPLLTTRRSGMQSALQGSGRAATEGRRSQRMRAGLIALEIAVSMVLLTGTTLMLRSVVALLHTDLGFHAERVVNASITLRQNRYPDASSRVALFDRVLSRLSAVPTVESVALTNAGPVQQPRLQPVEAVDSSARSRAGIQNVSDDYFATLDIPVVGGRVFTTTDRLGNELVAVVSQTLARRLWPEGSAVGRRILVPQEEEGGPARPTPRVIIGVVRDVRQGPADDDPADVYVPIRQAPGRFAFVLTRTTASPVSMLSPFRSAFRDIDQEIAVQTPKALQATVDELTARPRFLASLLAAFAAIAALLTLVGVYGVIAYAVRQREREIAVRLALGADPARLTRLFVRQGGFILTVGLALGVFGALGAGRLIESQLFGVTSRDPVALAGAAGLFALAGLLAIWWPARRATATDPAFALRAE